MIAEAGTARAGEELVREAALTRSLRAARERAGERYERIVGAGWELIGETGGTDFKLQDLAARAGVSLRAVYTYFANRDELLLAVFARGIESTLPLIRAEVQRQTGPTRKLRAYVESLYRLVFDQERPQTLPLTYYHLELTRKDPAALGRVLAPRNEILVSILREGVRAGEFRRDIPLTQLAVLLSQTLLAVVHTNALGSGLAPVRLTLPNVWRFCFGAVRAGD